MVDTDELFSEIKDTCKQLVPMRNFILNDKIVLDKWKEYKKTKVYKDKIKEIEQEFRKLG